MRKAKGFLVDNIPMCCDCALLFLKQSNYPHLFLVTAKMIDMDVSKKCCCDKYPDREECLQAADEIIKIISEKFKEKRKENHEG